MAQEMQQTQSRNPMEPVRQTIFEQSPTVVFIPPNNPQYLTEGQTEFGWFPGQTAMGGIDWASIGSYAADLASKVMFDHQEYLVRSQYNAFEDLKDSTQSKLDSLYMESAMLHHNASQAKTHVPDDRIASLVERMNALHGDFRSKASTILETDGYFNPDLDVKSMGSAWQELAVAVRKGDRDVANTINKLLFEMQATTSGKEKTFDDVSAFKQGRAKLKEDNPGSLMTAGLMSVNQPGQDAPFFVTKDEPFGIEAETGKPYVDQTGQPVVYKDNDTADWYVNANADMSVLPDNHIRALVDTETNVPYDHPMARATATVSDNGSLVTPLIAAKAKLVAESPHPNKGDAYYVGYALSKVSPDGLASIAKSTGLNKEQADKLQLIRLSVANGSSKEDIEKISNLNTTVISDAVQFVNAIESGRVDPTSGTLMVDAKSAGMPIKMAAAMAESFTYAGVALLQASGIPESSDWTKSENYAMENDGTSIYSDSSLNVSLTKLISANPEWKASLITSYAYAMANPQLYTDKDGTVDSEKFKKAVADFAVADLGVRGNSLLYTNDGTPMIVPNKRLTWVSAAIKQMNSVETVDPNEAMTRLFTVDLDDAVVPRAYENPTSAATNWATSISMNANRDAVTALCDNLVSVSRLQTGEAVSSGLSKGEILRVAAAATPQVWQKLLGVKLLADEPVSSDDAIAYTLEAYKLIATGKDWKFTNVMNSMQQSFVASPNGIIPFGITSIPAKTRNGVEIDLKDYMLPSNRSVGGAVIPISKNEGVPVLGIEGIDPEYRDSKLGDVATKLYRASPKVTAVKDSAPNTSPIGTPKALMMTTSMDVPPLLKQSLSQYTEPLKTPEAASQFVVQNWSQLKDVYSKEPGYEGVDRLLREIEPGKTNPNGRVFFNQDIAERTYERAKDLNNGNPPTAEQYVGVLFNAAKIRLDNTMRNSPTAPNMLDPKSELFDNEALDKLKLGYTIYRTPGNVLLYMKPEEAAQQKGLIPVMDPKHQDETHDEFIKRYDAEFGTHKKKRELRKLFNQTVGNSL